MTETLSEGFCANRCEIDDYVGAVEEMGVMEQTADLDSNPDEHHEERASGLRLLLSYQSGILEACRQNASTRPCEGRNVDGVGTSISDKPIHNRTVY